MPQLLFREAKRLAVLRVVLLPCEMPVDSGIVYTASVDRQFES